MPPGPPLTYEAVCTIVGRLYLESQHEIQSSARTVADLTARLARAEQERDEARSKVSASGPGPA